MHFLQDKSILVTGGTGSFGSALVEKLLKISRPKRIIVYSRDELKQFEMKNRISSPNLSYVLGDVRDVDRLSSVMSGVDYVVHAAAMKQIPASEQNPTEAIRTNIIGAENIIKSALDASVDKVIALSTDKAANPANLYGATKLCSDKLMIAANMLESSAKTKFSAVRYGNVLGSRGSVIPFFLSMKKEGFIPITDLKMTRFWITIEQGVNFVLDSLNTMKGGEIFVPKIKSFTVEKIARIVAPDLPIRIIGVRPGEKIHEVMVTEDDSNTTFNLSNCFAIVSENVPSYSYYLKNFEKVQTGFRYSSDSNEDWYSIESFTELLKELNLLT
jgi:UDP-N-acetylglucosamine 4,6-dehydratase